MGNLRSSNMQYTTIALLAIAGIAMSAPLGNLEMQNVFETFKADFNKVYDGAAEEAIRFKVFAENVNMIRDFTHAPAKNQEQCGSCWAFSTTGAAEGRLFIKNKKLVSLSEQELVDCAGSFGNQGCNGGLMDDGFKYMASKGDEQEASYPYTAKTGTKDVTPQSCADLMAAVQEGPVSVAIEADQSGFQHYSSGIFSGTCGTQLDHGVLVVGY